MQTDVSTIKEQIKTKMAENELNNVNVKIGTQLWDSYYTMSASQLQEIGVSAKNDCIYDYNTGNLSLKQNNDYITPEELYAASSSTNYIQGYVQLYFGTAEVTDAKIASETDLTIKAALQKQQLAQKYTNGKIKIKIYDHDISASLDAALELGEPKYETQTTNNGYFILENINVNASTYILISNFENTVCFYEKLESSRLNTMLFSKANPLKIFQNDYSRDNYTDIGDLLVMLPHLGVVSDVKIYDANKDGVVSNLDWEFQESLLDRYWDYDQTFN